MNQDDVITSPTVLSESTSVEFESIELEVNTRGEIVLCPTKAAMLNPTLYMSCQGGKITIEDIYHNQITLPGKWTPEMLRMGFPLDMTVSREASVKIVFTNLGPGKANVGASLVATPSLVTPLDKT